MTERQKYIAAAINPTYNGFATKKEVKDAKLLARGHYWNEVEFYQFCAYSPTGRREFFGYLFYSWTTPDKMKEWKREARKAAKLWALGDNV